MPSKKKTLGKRKVGQKSAKNADSSTLSVRYDNVANAEGVYPPSSSDPHRYGATLPLQPYDYSALYYHMEKFFEIDKDSEAMYEGSYFCTTISTAAF